MQRVKFSVGLVLLCVLPMWIGSSNGCFAEDGGQLKLHLEQKLITAAAGCAQIPCGFTDLPTTFMAREIWFKGSPASPLSPEEVEKKNGLSRPLSTLKECSIILWDLIGLDRTEEYGFMLKLATNETHIFPETVQVSYSAVKMNISLSSDIIVATKMTLLTCSLSDLCLASDPKITWKGLRSKQYFPLRYRLKEDNVLKYYENLHYSPVSEDHQTEITCEVTFGKNLTASATVTLTVHSEPQILNSSACTRQQDLLTCVCVSQGVPLPDIHWPLLKGKRDFTTVRASDGHMTVNSTFMITAEDFGRIGTVICIGTNELGQANMTLPVIFEGNPDQSNELPVTFEGNPDPDTK
ncbi:sialic acid-binding Ig-like lectin 14 [Triplophysa rosa]|uniref:Sialic acid-binding Ig-like lectin 6 n=1 Tax=Triplophysa rosa TaxID=992332 RepID=A0A9W7WIH0_TRIRA|nr:sialic acid-binding Ig-like lectin 14 [Triplophysa rosa]KAI7803012.1 putative sialic acid-binding Ig-like lectin 6 [Triplophysa rosa]